MENFKTIAVTGATGFLGSHLTERLIKDGYQVKILARDQEKAKRFENRVAEIVIGDIADEKVLDQLMQGCDGVFHLVSNFRQVKGSEESYYSTNLQGTKNALRAARQAGVKRFVHCSTIGVHGDVEQTPANEESAYNPGDLYQITKRDAELACHEEMKQDGMDIVIVRPCSQYGPGDLRMLKMFKMLAKKRFLMLGSCEQNFHAVYIDDIVEGFMLCLLTPNIAGETFLIGGEPYMSLRQYVDIAASALGLQKATINLPYAPFYYAAWVCELLCKPLGIEPPLHRRRVKFFKNNRAFDISKAKKLLHYKPEVSLEEGMRRTVQWYKDEGLL